MAWLTHLSRFLFAVVVVAAAMALAPAGAQAHAGHSHGPAKVEHSAPTPHASGSARTGYALTGQVRLGQAAVWAAALDISDGTATEGCAGGCCHSAGHGCCAAALPALLTVGNPPMAPVRLFAHVLWGPGITPGVLPEPPNHLV